ncbi:hypothetical protein V8E55_008547 [Tylopilus felleus]
MTSGYAITTLVVYIISIFFVIRPVVFPTPRPLPQISINLTTAPTLAIAFLWAAQCLDLTIIRNGIVGTEGVKPYNILVLFFSLAYMATTLDITDILWTTLSCVSNKGGQNGWKVYRHFYFVFSLLSIMLGSGSVVTTGAGFLVHYTDASRLEPGPWIMAEFAAVNTASMVLFMGSLTNVIISEGFNINSAAFTAYTILPFLTCHLSCFLALALRYRHQVPRRLLHATHREPRPAWDPVGASVGSVVLGAALIFSLVVSFFGIDVWMITLPFAVAKLLFDLGWDHYRHTRGISTFGRTSPLGIQQRGGARRSRVPDEEESSSSPQDGETTPLLPPETPTADSATLSQSLATPEMGTSLQWPSLSDLHDQLDWLDKHFPTFITALRRMPFTIVLFAFSQFILVEALDHQGWVNVFAHWLVRASGNRVQSTVWLVGVLDIILSNLLGTNIGATILLAKVVHAATLPREAQLGAAIALVVASNIGAVNFTFSASFAGLLWRAALQQKGINISQGKFAFRNILPLLMMTIVGLWTVTAEVAVLLPQKVNRDGAT